MEIFNEGWYLIYTRPRQERKVAQQLIEKRIEHFLPTDRRVSQWHDRKRVVQAPLFPSYVFVRLECHSDFYSASDCEGACYFVRFNKQPVRIQDKVIENIRVIVDNFSDIGVSHEHFHPKQQLLIGEGPLTGLECEVVRLNGRKKILVRVQLLNRSLLVDLPMEYVACEGGKMSQERVLYSKL